MIANSTSRICLIDTMKPILLCMADFIDLETRKVVRFELPAVLPDVGVEQGDLLLCNYTNSRILELFVLEV